MLIDMRDLKLSLDGARILDGVYLRLEAEQIYGLLGPNGAGKSTTIFVILGLYQAESGALELFGAADPSSPEIRRRIGVMPEYAGFYDWMNAQEYLAWYAGLYGGPRRPVPELLRQVGLEGAGPRPIGQFSRGMRQRLALARALAHRPKLLILDEPTSGLDPRGRREIHDLLRSMVREEGVGILLSTHLLDDVDRLCDRIGIIDQGRTVLEGPLAELLGRYRSGRTFRIRMETPGRNLLPKGATLLSEDDGWLRLSLDPGTDPADLWRSLMERGWRIAEIHAEGGGLEELYMQLTRARGEVDLEQAA
jgi:ABC-2 type transport system ATP-binding protein